MNHPWKKQGWWEFPRIVFELIEVGWVLVTGKTR